MRDFPGPVAPKHPDELARLESLRALDVLDSEVDDRFEDITALASQICQTPIALVSLVDAERQWFKSHLGTHVCQTDLSRSVCAYTILSQDVLVIPDTTKDQRTALNPLLGEELGMRFYAGAPLIGQDGLPYGSLCVIDTVPREMTTHQIDALRRLASQVVHLLEARRVLFERQAALEQAEVLKAEIDHRVANSLQQVAVLLRLQARRLANEEAAAAVEMARQRVEGISSLHRTISALSDGQRVDLESLFDTLTEEIGAVLPGNIRIQSDVVPIMIEARSAVHLAMILNEFVANSQKYAYPDERPGTVSVSARVAGEIVELVLSDDGIGWQGAPPEAQSTGIGMRVIEAAVQSLDGEMSISGEAGCVMTVSFPPAGLAAVKRP